MGIDSSEWVQGLKRWWITASLSRTHSQPEVQLRQKSHVLMFSPPWHFSECSESGTSWGHFPGFSVNKIDAGWEVVLLLPQAAQCFLSGVTGKEAIMGSTAHRFHRQV